MPLTDCLATYSSNNISSLNSGLISAREKYSDEAAEVVKPTPLSMVLQTNQKFNYNQQKPEHIITMLVFYSMIFVLSFSGNMIMIMVMYFGMRSSFLDVSIYLVNLGK
jgi:hypothetical protein